MRLSVDCGTMDSGFCEGLVDSLFGGGHRDQEIVATHTGLTPASLSNVETRFGREVQRTLWASSVARCADSWQDYRPGPLCCGARPLFSQQLVGLFVVSLPKVANFLKLCGFLHGVSPTFPRWKLTLLLRRSSACAASFTMLSGPRSTYGSWAPAAQMNTSTALRTLEEGLSRSVRQLMHQMKRGHGLGFFKSCIRRSGARRIRSLTKAKPEG